MAKKPTPKKRRAKSHGRRQYAEYVRKQRRRLLESANSPYSVAVSKKQETKKKITRIKA